MQSQQVVPEGLAAMPPGPGLACLLADIEPTQVCNDDIVDVLTAQSRQLAHDQARMFTALDEVIHRLPFAGPGQIRRAQHPERYGADEARAALAWTRRAADAETDLAHTLIHLLPLVHAALLAGHIDRPKAAVFARHLYDLSSAQITAICHAVLPHAPRLATGQIAERIKRLILELDPAYYERRYRKAVRDRMAIAYLSDDGTAVISATGLPADEAAAAWERLDTLARAAHHDGHPGTLDQLRADLVLGLLDGTLHNLTRPEILHALLERFAGHADTNTSTEAGTGAGTEAGAEAGTLVRAGPNAHPPDSPDEPVSNGGGNGNDGSDSNSNSGDGGDGGDGNGSHGSSRDRCEIDRCDETDPIDSTSDDHRTNPSPTADPTQAPPPPTQQVGTEIRIPLSTLLELDDRPGELPGWGPIPAHAARRTVTRQRRAQWRWAVLDDTGHLIAEGITRHRPAPLPRGGPRGGVVEIQVPAALLATLAAAPENHGPWAGVITDIAAQFRAHDHDSTIADLDAHPHERFPRAGLRRHTQVRDRACVHPGCRTPARRADQDHTLDHDRGGTTTQDDLAPLCRHHHMLKTEGGWELQQPEPGRFIWRSPLGRTYAVEPEPILPPPPTPVTRDHDPWFDEPARETDQEPDLRPRDRAPPVQDTAPNPTPGPEDDTPPPF